MTQILCIFLPFILSFSVAAEALKGLGTTINTEKTIVLSNEQLKNASLKQEADTLRLNFGDFSLLMPGIEVYGNEFKRLKDSITIYPELGYDLDSQVMLVRPKTNIKNIKVYESY